MANKLPNATAGMTFPRPKPDTPPSMVKKIGKTTYLGSHFVRKWLPNFLSSQPNVIEL